MPGKGPRTLQYVYSCQKTLKQIEQIFRGFDDVNQQEDDHRELDATPQSQYEAGKTKQKRSKMSRIFHVALAELKWLLSKGDTMELIEQIERHKNTCILALSTDQRYDL